MLHWSKGGQKNVDPTKLSLVTSILIIKEGESFLPAIAWYLTVSVL